MKLYARIMMSAALLALASAGSAQDMRPADFDHPEEKRQLLRLIEWPEIKGDIEVILSCFSQIKKSGKMDNTGCYLQNNYDEPFVYSINQAARKARLNPAIIDGDPQEIYLQFQVKFVAKGEERDIFFILNPGYEENVNAYGFGHIAGQRVIGKNEPWNDACPQRAHYAVWIRAYLGVDGVADSPTVDHADGILPTTACQNAIKQTILQSRYTPAYADGEPVPSTFVEAFTN